MAERIRWSISHVGACDMECEHQSCQAWQRAGGHCLLCANALSPPIPSAGATVLFAYRSSGTGASHVTCRLNHLAGRQPIPRFTSEDGEIQIGMPQSEDDVENLIRFAEAARRFLAAIDSVLRACDGAAIVPLPDRPAGDAS
jgi:hypothetical protein